MQCVPAFSTVPSCLGIVSCFPGHSPPNGRAWAAAEVATETADDTSGEFTESTEEIGNVRRTARDKEKLSKAEGRYRCRCRPDH